MCALIVRQLFAIGCRTARAHWIDSRLRDRKAVALIAIVRLLVATLACPRIDKHLGSSFRSRDCRGWYREQAYLRQVAWLPGEICGWYFCEDGYVPVVTDRQRTTSPWHSSWNAGLGLEVATGGEGTFFVEARYQRISAYNDKLEFVPIRFGLRF